MTDKGAVSDPLAERLLRALADERWDFRTVEGLSRELGVDESLVQSYLDSLSSYVRKSPIRDRKGRDLFTLRKRPIGGQEALAMIRSIISKST